MVSEREIRVILDTINSTPGLVGCLVGAHLNGISRIVQNTYSISINNDVFAVIEQAPVSTAEFNVLVNTTARASTSASVARRAVVRTTTPEIITNRSRQSEEFVNFGLSCGFAALSIVGAVGTTAAAASTGGLATPLAVLLWGGAAISYGQCLDAAYRFSEAAANPHSDSLQRLDEDGMYQLVIGLLDTAGIITDIASLGVSGRSIVTTLRLRGALASADDLRRMGVATRRAEVLRAVRSAASTSTGRAEMIEALRSHYTRAQIDEILGTVAVRMAGRTRHGRRITTAVAEVLNSRLRDALMDIGTTMLSRGLDVGADYYFDSSISSTAAARSSGNSIIIHIIEEE